MVYKFLEGRNQKDFRIPQSALSKGQLGQLA